MSIIIRAPLYRYSVCAGIIIDQQYIYYTDGTYYWRKGVRDSKYVIDKTLTVTGFNGTEGVDWENVWSLT